MSELRYPVPWDQIVALAPHIARGTPAPFDQITASLVARMQPAPLVVGLENLPADARFVLVANHYQRPGLWIAHCAAVLTQAVRRRYGPGDPPVGWIVTANWPRLRIGTWRCASPGDWLLPRVARALGCYPVSRAGANPHFTAGSIGRLLRDTRTLDRPIGLFPEGASATAGRLQAPVAGIGRLLGLLARRGWPVQPAAISESDRLVVHFGAAIAPRDILASPDPGALAIEAIAHCQNNFAIRNAEPAKNPSNA